ncbi:MAG: hypothetical protein IV108_08915 [Burkholderiales bacterium]|nr:hypothetical protein [Burkholderiales bacterium]
MIIDIFSISRLAQKLAANEVQGWRAAIFLILGNLLYILFAFVAAHILGFSGSRYIEAAIAEAAIAAVIVIFGVRICYNAYSGSNFMQAFIVLSVPALIYSTILSWAIHWSVLYAVEQYGKTTSFPTSAAAADSMANAAKVLEGGAMLAAAAGLLSFYYLVRVGLKIANGKGDATL